MRLFDSLPEQIAAKRLVKSFYSLDKSDKVNYYTIDYYVRSIPKKIIRRFRFYSYRELEKKYFNKRPDGLEAFQNILHYHHYRLKVSPDIIHIHWISDFFNFEKFFQSISDDSQIVITLHDQSFFTGGCPYDLGCGKYRTGCNSCPQLDTGKRDLVEEFYRQKAKIFQHKNIHVVANSQWIEEEARKSKVLANARSIQTINYGFDPVTPKINKQSFRKQHGIKSSEFIILAGADNREVKRKGFDLLIDAFSLLQKNTSQEVRLLLFGDGERYNDDRIISLGKVNDASVLATFYLSADLLIFPSVSEAFGLICLEAMSYGLPVMGFDNGGLTEMIVDKQSGFIVKEQNPRVLAQEVMELMNNPEILQRIAIEAKNRSSEIFSVQSYLKNHLNLYRRILNE